MSSVHAGHAQIVLGCKRRLEVALAVEDRGARRRFLEDDEAVGGDLDQSIRGVPIGTAQRCDGSGMDVDDLREFIAGGGNQDGGALPAAGDDGTRGAKPRLSVFTPCVFCVAVVVVHRFVHSSPSCFQPLHVVVVEHVTTMFSAKARGKSVPQGAEASSPVALSRMMSRKKI